jgi:SAM-dependent methyltransferase
MSFFRFCRRRSSSTSSLDDTLEQVGSAAFFAPTPWAVAREMLEFAELTAGDILYDLGSGDGRIPIMAAQEFGVRAIGIEIDNKLRRHAEEKTREYGLETLVTFRGEDFFRTDLREATVVTLYLLSVVNGHLGPRLASQLPKGARVVCLDYEVPGWRYVESKPVKSEGGVDYTLYLYRR